MVKKRSEIARGVGETTDVLIAKAVKKKKRNKTVTEGKQWAVRENTKIMDILDAYYKEIKESEEAITCRFQKLLEEPIKKIFG